MARPKKIIDQEIFEELCKIQCTQEEICSVLKVDDKTLTRFCKETYNASFSEVFAQKRKAGASSLRRMQWRSAEQGNTTMQIWLGKQYIGQRDKFDNDTNVTSEISITVKEV